ncbi:hypothetical protein B0A55_08431 [Friedmanniomyces simplex]|uniref:Mid2 domain-containing protein n=1 Tax=Friedmanniomyces simplex TaxID=329884 RepID=A0A4V5NGX8_9PEZI|nr:hypothetical protein B0A55_08431 [Friedmanniomyces simplex]
MRSLSNTLAIILVVLLGTLLHIRSATAQNCYYPDGNLTNGPDAACSSGGGACCPYQWECLSNGLCYLPTAAYYGRYTCTDATWQSSSCPQLCTEGNTAPGDEALLQCSDGSWCCDGDRSFNCCTTADTNYFLLPQGTSYASITSVPSPTPVASPVSGNSPASTSLATPTTPGGSSQQQTSSSESDSSTTPSSSSAPSSASTASDSATSSSTASSKTSPTSLTGSSTVTSDAVTTNTDGSVSTIVLYSTVPAAAGSSGQPPKGLSHPSSSSHLGLIIGLAVGIPLFLLACAIIAFLLWKRRKANKQKHASSSHLSEYQPVTTDKYGHQVGHVAPDGRASEIDSYPVAMGRSKSGRKSELEGSLHSPAISDGSPKPPGYSPASPNLNTVAEEPAELWGGYVPYRPPRAEPQDTRAS